MYKILVTNDDGIFSYGLEILVREIKKVGKTVVVVPEGEQSAVSHSLTLHYPIKVKKISDSIYVLRGTPADCVRFGIIKIFKNKVDLVISGINDGPNLGYDVTYSGTVAGAREAVLMNVPGIAVSLFTKKNRNYKTASIIARKIAEVILKNSKIKNQKPIFLNVNVPDLQLKKIKGICIAKLGMRRYENKIKTTKGPYGLPYYWLKSKPLNTFNRTGDTDIEMIEKGKVTITPLMVDLTNFSLVQKFKNIFEFQNNFI